MSAIPSTLNSQPSTDLPPHSCRIPGCSVVIAANQLMCRRHWRQVPYLLQRKIWQHWKALFAGKEGARILHTAATEAAIAAVTDNSATKERKDHKEKEPALSSLRSLAATDPSIHKSTNP